MIDLAAGTVDREIFTSPDIHRQELEKLFARTWLFVGHDSQIPKPGDFFVSRMATSRSSCAATALARSTSSLTPAGIAA